MTAQVSHEKVVGKQNPDLLTDKQVKDLTAIIEQSKQLEASLRDLGAIKGHQMNLQKLQ